MGQTASAAQNIDQENPRPEEYTFANVDKELVDVERVHQAQVSSPDARDEQEIDRVADSVDNMQERKKKKKKKKEDEIDQEQAKQDLLAYLEILGENATNLPLTWRDDPQLGRTISTLTTKEYARKADAFIPCDLRIIGATTVDAPRNADVPIKQSMKIGERSSEPTISNGGAICNTLLKALYDFENGDLIEDEHADATDFNVNDNLFDDDDDDSIGDASIGSIQFDETVAGASLSWQTLIRRMKEEMENQGYEQIPVLTSSRQFDLSEPVHLLPPNFDHKLNRKFALLVGCNYKGRFGELRNSHNDIKVMKDYIVNVHGFPEKDDYMKILIDDGKHKKPSHGNIINALREISLRTRPGDAVFIQFAGHGGRVLDINAENDCFDEVFAPYDYHKRGLISEKVLIRSLIVSMAEDVTVTMLCDSCSGFVFDMPFSWETRDDSGETLAKLAVNDNFSFIRFLDVVKNLYDSSLSADFDIDDDAEFNHKKNSLVMALGNTLVDVAKDVAVVAEIEAQNMAKKTMKITKKIIEAAKEGDDDSYDEDSVGDEERSYDDYDDDDSLSDHSYY